MKKLLLLLFVFSSLQMVYGQSKKTKTAEIKTEIICDHCLECESCDLNIFTKIKKNTKGVRSVKVNAEQNTITVKYNSKKTNLTEIEQAIALSGYRANEVKPTAEDYDSLDACCK